MIFKEALESTRSRLGVPWLGEACDSEAARPLGMNKWDIFGTVSVASVSSADEEGATEPELVFELPGGASVTSVDGFPTLS